MFKTYFIFLGQNLSYRIASQKNFIFSQHSLVANFSWQKNLQPILKKCYPENNEIRLKETFAIYIIAILQLPLKKKLFNK